MRFPRSAVLAAVLALLAPAAAVAQEQGPPGPQMLANIEVDPGASFEHALVECDVPPPGASSCAVRIVLKVDGQTVLDRQTDIPVNESGIDIKVKTSKQRDAALLAGRHKIRSELQVLFQSDGSVGDSARRTDKLGGWAPKAKALQCGVPEIVAADGPVRAVWGDQSFHMTGAVPGWLGVAALRAVTFKANGLTYHVAKRTRFSLQCVSVGAVHAGRYFPGLILSSGKVRVEGTPDGDKQLASSVITHEGGFSSQKVEHVDYTVVRNAKKRRAELHVSDGDTMEAVHLLFGGPNFPCTPGHDIVLTAKGI